MIITLEEAKKHYKAATQEDLDGIEQAIRELTNNPFQNRNVRFRQIRFDSETKIVVHDELFGLRSGDTVQVSGSTLNNGLYLVKEVEATSLIFERANFFIGSDSGAYITKVEYPADIIAGVVKLLKYDAKMINKIGLKSKSVSRMSETYFDQNSGETINGYPAAMFAFINKYRLLRW